MPSMVIAVMITVSVMNFVIVPVVISISVAALFFCLAGRQIAIPPSRFLALAPTRRVLITIAVAVLIVATVAVLIVVTVMVLIVVIVMMREAVAIIIVAVAVMSFAVVFRKSHSRQKGPAQARN